MRTELASVGHLMLCVMALGLLPMEETVADQGFCFNAGAVNGWDCTRRASTAEVSDRAYHTLKITLSPGQDLAELSDGLALERIGDFPLPDGGRVAFLGRFPNREAAATEWFNCLDQDLFTCGRFSIETVRIGDGVNESDRRPGERDRVSVVDSAETRLSIDLSYSAISQAFRSAAGQRRPKGVIALPHRVEGLLWIELGHRELHILRHKEGRLLLAETIALADGHLDDSPARHDKRSIPTGLYRIRAGADDVASSARCKAATHLSVVSRVGDGRAGRVPQGLLLQRISPAGNQRVSKAGRTCLVLPDAVLDAINWTADLRSVPVLIDHELSWVGDDATASLRTAVMQGIDSWRRGQSRADGMQSRITAIAEDATPAEQGHPTTQISDLSLVHYPGLDNTVFARFLVQEQSGGAGISGWHEQFWQKGEAGRWQLLAAQR